MNKQAFLNELEKALSCLSPEEKQDILRDMQEYFYEGNQRGQSDEEMVKKLGQPKTIADTIIAEKKVERIKKANTIPQKFSAVFSALFAILLLTPLNLIFVFIPLLLATLFILIGWPIVFLITVTLPIILLASLIFSLFIGFKFLALLAILFFVIGWSSMIAAIVIGFSCLTWAYFRAIAKLLDWNIQFVKNRVRGK
jgi:uncharacterized membrane protein